MKQFSEFGIKSSKLAFSGDKIKISRVLNKEIVVLDFKTDDSKFPKNKSGKVLTLQIEESNEKRIIFTGSDFLMDQINQVDKSNLPFTTTIVKIGEHFEFT